MICNEGLINTYLHSCLNMFFKVTHPVMSPFVLDRTTPRFNRQVALALIDQLIKPWPCFSWDFFCKTPEFFRPKKTTATKTHHHFETQPNQFPYQQFLHCSFRGKSTNSPQPHSYHLLINRGLMISWGYKPTDPKLLLPSLKLTANAPEKTNTPLEVWRFLTWKPSF